MVLWQIMIIVLRIGIRKRRIQQEIYMSGFWGCMTRIFTVINGQVPLKIRLFSISFALENSKGNVIGALIYNFDLPQLAEILCASNYEENGKVAILNEDGIIMSRSDNSGTGSVLDIPEEEHEIMKNEKTGRFWTEIDGKEYFVSFQTTSMGLKLVSYIPQSEIFKHTRSMIWLLVLIIFCSLTLNLLITFKVSDSIKRPIQKLMDNIQNVNSHKLRLWRQKDIIIKS